MSLQELKKEVEQAEKQYQEIMKKAKLDLSKAKQKLVNEIRKTYKFVFVIEVDARPITPGYIRFQEDKGLFSSKEKALEAFPEFWKGDCYKKDNHCYFFKQKFVNHLKFLAKLF